YIKYLHIIVYFICKYLNFLNKLLIKTGVWPWIAAVIASKATPYVIAGAIFVGGVCCCLIYQWLKLN
ncbi:MAG: hypothetical protein RSB70_06850, partial [Clostridium sp.]